MKNLIYTFAIAIFTLTSCSNYGEKIEVDGTEVYYKNGVSKEQAEKLGNFLKSEGFTDGSKKSVQFVKDEKSKNLAFKMVTDESFINDSANLFIFESTVRNLTNEFGQPVDLQLCDNTFKPLKTFPAANVAQSLSKGNIEVLYTQNVTKEEAQSLLEFLTKSDEEESNGMTTMLDKSGDNYIYKMVVKPGFENDESYENLMKAYSSVMSNQLFNDAPISIHLCDDNFKTLKIIEQ